MKHLVVVAPIVLVAMFMANESHAAWQEECSGGLNDSDNTSVRALAPFNGTLYAGTYSTFDHAEVWARVPLGDTWVWIERKTGGFGDVGNLGISSMTAFEPLSPLPSALYIGTFNYNTGCEIWVTTDGTNFYQTHSDGFGYGTSNTDAGSMAVFNGDLYVGTTNGSGLEIHKFTGVTWVESVIGGFDGNPNNDSATCMTVHDGWLYVGTENYVTGGEIWRSDDGIAWERYLFGGFGRTSILGLASVGETLFATVAGDPPLDPGLEVHSVGDVFSIQVNTDGFGDTANIAASAMVDYHGSLVVGTQNNTGGAQVWRMDGFLDWTSTATGGFGSTNNIFIPTLTVLDHDLFAGTSNAFGAEIWVYPAIFSDGFESGSVTAWSSATP